MLNIKISLGRVRVIYWARVGHVPLSKVNELIHVLTLCPRGALDMTSLLETQGQQIDIDATIPFEGLEHVGCTAL